MRQTKPKAKASKFRLPPPRRGLAPAHREDDVDAVAIGEELKGACVTLADRVAVDLRRRVLSTAVRRYCAILGLAEAAIQFFSRNKYIIDESKCMVGSL
jgi:hypothetical protein